MGSIHQIGAAFQFVNEQAKTFTNLQMEMTDANLDWTEITNQANNYARALSGTTDQVMKAIGVFGTYTSTMDEVMNKSRAAIIMSNISSQGIEVSADAIMASMEQFKMASGDSMKVIDSIASTARMLQMDFPLAIREISQGMKKAGSIVYESGTSFETFTGMMATMIEKTRLSGSEIGNSLKSIYSHFQRFGEETDPETFKALEMELHLIGISMKDLNGEMIPTDQVLGQLAGKWELLSDAQRNHIAQLGAGGWQLSKFIALMSNWEDVTTNTTAALDSQGVAEQKNAIFADSLQGAQNRLKDSLEALYLKYLNPEVLKNWVNWGDHMLTVINRTGTLSVAIGILSAALTGLALKALIPLIASIGGFIQILFLAKSAAEATTIAVAMMGGAFTVIIGVVALVVGGLVALNDIESKATQSSIDLAKQTKEVTKSLEDLKGKTELTADEHERLRSASQRLADLYPSLRGEVDTMSLSYENLASAANRATVEMLKARQADLEKQQSDIERLSPNYSFQGERVEGDAGLDAKSASIYKQITALQHEINIAMDLNPEVSRDPSQLISGNRASNVSKASNDLVARKAALASAKAAEEARLQKIRDDEAARKKAEAAALAHANRTPAQIHAELNASDMTKELIKSYSAESSITAQKIKQLEAQQKISKEAKDYKAQIEDQNKLQALQTTQVSQLQSANVKIAAEAQILYKKNKESLTWFDANGEATTAWVKYYNSFSEKADLIRKQAIGQNADAVESANKRINELEAQQVEAQKLFNNISALKSAWTSNNDAATQLQITIKATAQEIESILAKQRAEIESNLKEIEELYKKKRDEVEANLTEIHKVEKDNLDEIFAKKEEQYDKDKQNLEDIKNAYTESQEAKIEAMEKELDIADDIASEKEDELDKSKKLLDIEKQKRALALAQTEKTAYVYTKTGWQWMADPRTVKAETDKLADLQEDYGTWSQQKSNDDIKKGKQALITAERDKQKIQNDSYDKQLKDLEKKFEVEQSTYKVSLAVIEKALADGMAQVKMSNFAGLETMLTDTRTKLTELKVPYNELSMENEMALAMSKVKSANSNALDIMLAETQAKLAAMKAMYAQMGLASGSPSGGASSSSTPQGTPTTVRMPDGSVRTGYINNGTTYDASGSAIKNDPTYMGAVVNTGGGDYIITGGGGAIKLNDNPSGGSQSVGQGGNWNSMTEYANGTDGAPLSDIYRTDEVGGELKWLPKDTRVLPSQLSKQLLELPSAISKIAGMESPKNLLSNNRDATQSDSKSTVHIENLTVKTNDGRGMINQLKRMT